MNRSETLKTQVAEYLNIIRRDKPRVHVITNHVSAGITARALTALGADPVMADYSRESAEITALSSALVINSGTPGEDSRKSCIAALSAAAEHGIPAMLDPVGCSASKLRRALIDDLLSGFRFSVIKGNISEIAYITYGDRSGAAVSAVKSQREPARTAMDCSEKYRAAVLVTGAVDTAASKAGLLKIRGGSSLSAAVSGTGCIAGAVCGTLLAAGSDPFTAAAGSSLLMRSAASKAAGQAGGPGTFLPLFIDALYNISGEEIIRNGEIYEETIT